MNSDPYTCIILYFPQYHKLHFSSQRKVADDSSESDDDVAMTRKVKAELQDEDTSCKKKKAKLNEEAEEVVAEVRLDNLTFNGLVQYVVKARQII